MGTIDQRLDDARHSTHLRIPAEWLANALAEFLECPTYRNRQTVASNLDAYSEAWILEKAGREA